MVGSADQPLTDTQLRIFAAAALPPIQLIAKPATSH